MKHERITATTAADQLMIDALAPPPRLIATLADLCMVAVLAFGTGILVMDMATARQIERWVERGGDLSIAGYTLVCELPLTNGCHARPVGPNEVRP
ncbi:hypothetical protein METUNv1_01782 [Methyloversatilis universalis FAM5]|uniref:Uncharacterized protein n=1 Tax=Methyloversatilis universalis (strain ATCC BAA-1314 / DSM 25237 / JCM 13912 / CCUG 52030 / FAM5) TaxID=1000565 RepID=F5RBY7_METUF|nr:hypothetical protein [Methyloversatilis universalis]EGK72004.1 hypothetical protein METUNv1_01782 [Methyloversatilis universalis FAM5]